MTNDLAAAVGRIIEAFESMDIPYYVGGSLASSAFGVARSTVDADLVADIDLVHVPALVDFLAGTYYLDSDSMREAIARRTSFNLVHLESMVKVDVFVPKNRSFDRSALARRIVNTESVLERPRVFFCSPEDTILIKLEWYLAGSRVSEKQWADIIGILRVQGSNIDCGYLSQWASVLGLSEVLAEALAEVHG